MELKNLFNESILERFEKTKERKPATNRIYLIQLISEQCLVKWGEVFALSQELTENELRHCLDEGKNAGRMILEKGVWREKTPQEFQLGIKKRTYWLMKQERLKIAKMKKESII